jgi:inorganic pyrophosphatase
VTILPHTATTKLSEIDPGPQCPDTVRMIVEIGKGSTNKYEYDIDLGVFRLDRVLYSPMHYPGDYGFIPGTIAEDGDPIDVLTLVDQPSFPGCVTDVRPVGMLEMIDDAEVDHKIIAVPLRNPRFDQIRMMDEIPDHVRREVEHFFEIYKELEGRTVKTRGWHSLDTAHKAIRSSRERFISTRIDAAESK